jgi:drug/metabolite transporter (DMT)-like permease
MEWAWVAVTLIAAAAQTARNATQSGLTARIGTLGATQVRFVYGLPFALLFLWVVLAVQGGPVPLPGARALGFAVMGALAQIGATALMLAAMQARGLAVATAWIKTEPVLIALMGALVLGDALTWPMVAAVVLATGGVLLMARPKGSPWALAPAALGLSAAALFGLAAIGFRGAILALPEGGFVLRASVILCLSLAVQVAVLGAWMAVRAPGVMVASLSLWRPSLAAGFLGAFASQFWFLGFALTSAANVRTLALVEVVFATAVGWLAFGQRLDQRQAAGALLVCLGVGGLLRLNA